MTSTYFMSVASSPYLSLVLEIWSFGLRLKSFVRRLEAKGGGERTSVQNSFFMSVVLGNNCMKLW